MKKLLIGTTNKAKLAEYKSLLADFPLELVSLKEAGIKEHPDDMGHTLEERAIKKARFYFEKSGMPTLVDQGGLEIEALEGNPGVEGKKWFGPELSDDELIAELMRRMQGKDNRGCKLHIVLALATPFGIMTADSSLHGEIAETVPDKKIENLPYNSVLFLPNYNKYYCDLSKNEKEILSQRKHAVEKIQDMLVGIGK